MVKVQAPPDASTRSRASDNAACLHLRATPSGSDKGASTKHVHVQGLPRVC